jgi:Type II secretion system (T2SS), protein M
MTGRDRLVIMGIVVLAVLAGGWLLLVSPERQKAAQQEAQVESARSQLQSARAEATTARTAETRYRGAYASVVSLGKAVPPLQEVPSLVYELEQASHQRDVDFNSIASGSAGASSPPGGSSSSASSSSGSDSASAATAAFTQMPFTFVFKGTFFQLAHLLGQIDGFAKTTAASGGSKGSHDATVSDEGGIQVNGRLLTIQGVDITLESQGRSTPGKSSTAVELTATITATAYVLPASQGLTAGATSAGPAGSATASTSSAGGSSSPASPAVIEGAP